MGNLASKYLSPLLSRENIWRFNSRKRKIPDEDDGEYEGTVDQVTPKKRRRIKGVSNARYIYQEFFKTGVYSDIKIIACDRKWSLHKVILKQCPYFASMLSGDWKESHEDVINIDVVDPNITAEALDVMFGSLYLDEIELHSCSMVALLAAASRFQMDRLTERCEEFMTKSISTTIALDYYNIAEQYGLLKVKDAAFDLLLRNVASNKHFWQLHHKIGVELMTKLIGHPELAVNPTEQNVYYMLLQWLYRHIVPQDSKRPLVDDINLYFYNRPGEEYLLTSEGIKYQSAFRALRLTDVLVSAIAVEQVTKIRVIPHEWIHRAVSDVYLRMLAAHDAVDIGPTEVDEEDLAVRGTRLGRVIRHQPVSWRWQGVYAGLLLTWSFTNNVLEVMRSRGSDHAPFLASNTRIRHIMCRVILGPVPGKCSPRILQTPIQIISLYVGQKAEVARLPENLSLPVSVQVELLFTTKKIHLVPEEGPIVFQNI